jgi:hypothetical protein
MCMEWSSFIRVRGNFRKGYAIGWEWWCHGALTTGSPHACTAGFSTMAGEYGATGASAGKHMLLHPTMQG